MGTVFPACHWESHRLAARVENARWLMGTCGLTLRQAATRLGVTHACLEKDLARASR